MLLRPVQIAPELPRRGHKGAAGTASANRALHKDGSERSDGAQHDVGKSERQEQDAVWAPPQADVASGDQPHWDPEVGAVRSSNAAMPTQPFAPAFDSRCRSRNASSPFQPPGSQRRGVLRMSKDAAQRLWQILSGASPAPAAAQAPAESPALTHALLLAHTSAAGAAQRQHVAAHAAGTAMHCADNSSVPRNVVDWRSVAARQERWHQVCPVSCYVGHASRLVRLCLCLRGSPCVARTHANTYETASAIRACLCKVTT